jgi:predicted amino acid racemase
MAFIKLNRKRLQHNYQFLDNHFKKRNIQWGVVSKLLCGSKVFLQELIELGVREMHDSRISNLKKIKTLSPEIQTVYIKPPAKRSIPNIVRYADVSFNTESVTIKMLSDEAIRQNKRHKIIIMIEMGDLREGVMGENLIQFYRKIIGIPNIDIVGIGTNLNCLSGVMPTKDKLIQLSLYKQLIESKFNITIPWVSGGTSVAVPLMLANNKPLVVNHFRVGEALFFGNDLFTGKQIKGMKSDVLKLYAEIIEITNKPNIPDGELGENLAGNVFDLKDAKEGNSNRAIVDIGLLDMQPEYVTLDDKELSIIDASSDMLVIDLGKSKKYKVGNLVAFDLKYMGALRLLNSNYIDKIVE